MSHVIFVQAHAMSGYNIEAREKRLAGMLAERGHDVQLFGMVYGRKELDQPAGDELAFRRRFFAPDSTDVDHASFTSRALVEAAASAGADLILFKGLGYKIVSDTIAALSPLQRRAIMYGGKWRSEENADFDLFLLEYGAQARYLESEFGRSPEDMIETPKFINWRLADDAVATTKQYDFVSVGAFIERKNHKALVPLLSRLSGCIVGDGPLRGAIEAERPSGSEVSFTGAIPKNRVPEAMAKARFLIHPSRWEGLPRVAIEAFSVGLPLVGLESTLGPALGDLEFAILADDEKNLVDQAVRLAADPARCEELGSQARAWALAIHGPRALLRTTERIEEWTERQQSRLLPRLSGADGGMRLHQYLDDEGNFSYEAYRHAQIEANHRKLGGQWVDENAIAWLSQYLRSRVPDISFGLCHGTRRGNEQKWFRDHLGCEVIGTEISDTATQFDHTVQWDFHEQNDEWIGRADFIYSNSWDHTYDPAHLFEVWAQQLTPHGLMLLEHSDMGHTGSTVSDPFGTPFQSLVKFINALAPNRFRVVDTLTNAPGITNKKGVHIDAKYVVVARR